MAQTVVTPERFGPRGDAWVAGHGKHKPMLVWGGIPGERSLVRVVGSGQHQTRSVWMSSRDPDPHRVDPVCDRYTACGGCSWMHLDPPVRLNDLGARITHWVHR